MRFGNWVLDSSKFMTKKEANRLLDLVRSRAEKAHLEGRKIAIRDYFIIHLALSTGLRAMEIAALNCGDIQLDDRISSVLVRRGKCRKKRLVLFTGPFKEHCEKYFHWKRQTGESTDPEQPLIISSNTGTYMTTRAIQKVFKRSAKRAGLSATYSVHSLRHSFACFLLKASDWNLRLVQKQLGHSKITTTQVYADVMMPDVKRALDRMNQ